jgi:hypothetical protein
MVGGEPREARTMRYQRLRVVLLGLGIAAVGVGMSGALARMAVRAVRRDDPHDVREKGSGR